MRNISTLKILFFTALAGLTTGAHSDVTLRSESNNDMCYRISGALKQEFIHQAQVRLLNKDLPDKYDYWKTTLMLFNKFDWGQETFGYKAVEGNVTLRHKGNFGTSGRTGITDTQSIKLGDALVGDVKHDSTKPLIWVPEAWLAVSLNALLGLKDLETMHTVKIGYFGFGLGRGIALGQIYGLNKGFLAIYNRISDFAAPGILFKGDIIENKLSYDLYTGFLENKSSSMSETFNHIKANHIGKEATPWSGTGNNNTVYALQITYSPLKEKKKELTFKPYGFYNEALDQKIEFAADSSSKMGSVGLEFEGRWGNWSFGFDTAHNYGSEYLARIDRNQAKIQQNNELLNTYYTHIEEDVDGTFVPAKAYKELRAELKNNRHLNNLETFSVTVSGTSTDFRSAANRVRPAYKNDYRGFMAVADIEYAVPKHGAKVAATVGYASGDGDPHASEVNKQYRGFVGVNELYNSKRVPSIFVLDERTTKRPLSLNEGGTYLEDPSFSDLVFVGGGLTYSPLFAPLNRQNLVMNFNILGFYKEHASAAVVNNVVSATEVARKYLGTEFNMIGKISPLNNMCISFKLGALLPGSYYADIKGATFAGDLFNTLDEADTQGLDSNQYRISKDTAYMANLVFEYLF